MGIFDSISKAVKSVTSFIDTGGGQFSSILSVQGQKERIANVINEFNPLSSNKNTLNPVIKQNAPKIVSAPLQFIAENPYTTIGLAAVAANPVGVASTLGKAFTSASLLTKTAVVGSALVAAPIVVSHPAESIDFGNKFIPTPDKLLDLGNNLNNVIKDPSLDNAKLILSKNGILLSEAAILALLASGGLSAIANYASIHATKKNTDAVIENTNASTITPNIPGGSSLPNQPINIINTIPTSTPTPTTPVSTPISTPEPIKKASAKKKKKKKVVKHRSKKKSKKKTIKRRKASKSRKKRKK
jgi:hypothetical protein